MTDKPFILPSGAGFSRRMAQFDFSRSLTRTNGACTCGDAYVAPLRAPEARLSLAHRAAEGGTVGTLGPRAPRPVGALPFPSSKNKTPIIRTARMCAVPQGLKPNVDSALIGTTEQAAEKVEIDGVPPAKAGSGDQILNNLDAGLKASST